MLRGKRFRSVPKVFPKNIQRIFDDIRAAFEALQADFERLPSVRLTPPPVFLRLVGPISTDLRPLHREKILEGSNVYSLGSVFLENLMCDNGTSWDLHSCLALVATKLTRRGRPYPPAFTSELSLLVKRLVKANPQLALQLGAQRQQLLTLKPLSESTGLEVSTTSRVVNDARIRKGAEDALMQRSLSTMISLSVRNLTSRLTRIGERLEFSGGFGEIRKAHLASSNGKMTVAVKYLRLYVTQATKRLYKEIRIWQRLNHPHVLLLLGVCHTATSESIHASIEHPDPMKSIEIVCPWMENGTLVNFLKLQQTEQENMEELRLRLLIQVCSGLMYLHSKNIVHSDLYGENVLVDSDGCARLADFGLSAVVAECRGTPGTSPGGRSSPPYGAWRWAAPELVLRQGDPDVRLHPSADIYSAGGLILQACTGDVPYSYYNDRRVLGAIITAEKPQRPTSDQAQISDALWSVIEECWQDDPLKRPTAAALESRLQAIYSGLGDEQA
ncbi:kinase-like domain-containing protein [Armillaria mellea]|nr:kinase-like domain-containing protein [Armillaria mellea]